MPKYRFEQIAINSTEKKKPTEEDRFTYLGLEHLDSGSLKVTRFGSDVAPIGEKLVMREGDVLFGKRRAYQKKVAIAPFDGIFSAHGMVLRPREEVIDNDFFPLFISSDYFLDAAIKISVGSLSPTINWRDLRNLEFNLPPLEEQRKLAKVLWAMNNTMEAYKKLIKATEELVKSQFIALFDPTKNQHQFPMGTILYLGENLDHRRIPITSGSRKKGPYPYYGASGIVDYVDGYIFDEDILLISEDGANLTARVTPIAFSSSGKVWVNNHAHVVRFPDSATQCYVEKLLNYLDLKDYITGTAQPKLNQEKLNSIPIPLPPDNCKSEFEAFVQQSDKSKFELEQALAELTATYKRIIAENLG